jgi:hypothetical protein
MNFVETNVKYRSKIIIKSLWLDVNWAVKQEVLPRLQLDWSKPPIVLVIARNEAISVVRGRQTDKGEIATLRSQ